VDRKWTEEDRTGSGQKRTGSHRVSNTTCTQRGNTWATSAQRGNTWATSAQRGNTWATSAQRGNTWATSAQRIRKDSARQSLPSRQTHTHTHIYIYIYIYTSRRRPVQQHPSGRHPEQSRLRCCEPTPANRRKSTEHQYYNDVTNTHEYTRSKSRGGGGVRTHIACH
jgi:hypothetical protein